MAYFATYVGEKNEYWLQGQVMTKGAEVEVSQRVFDFISTNEDFTVRVGEDPFDPRDNPIIVRQQGTFLAEQLTNANAVAGKLTFKEKIRTIEIYNTDTVNNGTFNVNGINILVPKSDSFMANVGGSTRDYVTVTGSTSYIVCRYE